MARIIYGAMGDSGGHINRSLAVAKEMPQHDFLFVGGGAVEAARMDGHRYSPLPMPATILRDNNVMAVDTVVNFGSILFGYKSIISDLCALIEDFKPDLAVTDYEFFLPRAARKVGVKCVSLDHQHIITNCHCPSLPEERWSRFITSCLIRQLFSAVDKYLVSSFFELPPKTEQTEVIPPIMHRDILDHVPSAGDHVVVYLRAGINQALMEGLLSLKRECHVYGMGKDGKHRNLHYMQRSRRDFLADLASCAYVICNAGHTLSCESLHLGKPVMAFPVSMFYEQYVNACHLKRLGYGDYGFAFKDCKQALAGFEEKVDLFRKNLEGVDLLGNERAAERLTAMLVSD